MQNNPQKQGLNLPFESCASLGRVRHTVWFEDVLQNVLGLVQARDGNGVSTCDHGLFVHISAHHPSTLKHIRFQTFPPLQGKFTHFQPIWDFTLYLTIGTEGELWEVFALSEVASHACSPDIQIPDPSAVSGVQLVHGLTMWAPSTRLLPWRKHPAQPIPGRPAKQIWGMSMLVGLLRNKLGEFFQTRTPEVYHSNCAINCHPENKNVKCYVSPRSMLVVKLWSNLRTSSPWELLKLPVQASQRRAPVALGSFTVRPYLSGHRLTWTRILMVAVSIIYMQLPRNKNQLWIIMIYLFTLILHIDICIDI